MALVTQKLRNVSESFISDEYYRYNDFCLLCISLNLTFCLFLYYQQYYSTMRAYPSL